MSRATALRIAVGLFVAVLLVALAGAGLLVAVSHGLARERVRGALEGALARALDAPVALGALEGPLHRAPVLRDLVVGPGEAPLLRVERAALRLDALALVRARRLDVGALELEGVRYALRQRDDGGWSGLGLPDAEGAGESSAEPTGGLLSSGLPVPVRIGALLLRDGALALRWRDAEAEWRVDVAVALEARDIELPLSAARAALPGAVLSLRAGPAPIAPAARLDASALEIELDAGRLAISKGELRGSFGALDLSGGAELLGWLDAARPGRAELELGFRALDPALAVGVAGALSGRARVEAALAAGAPLADLALRIDLESADSLLAGRRIERLALRGSVAAGAWHLEEGAARGEGLELAARGRGDADAIAELAVDGRVERLGAFQPTGAETGVEGSAEIHARLSGALARPVGELSLRVRALRVRGVALGSGELALRSDEPGVLQLESLALAGGALPLVSQGTALVHLLPGAVRVEGLRLASGAQRLALDGEIGAERVRALLIAAREIDVGALAQLAGAPVALGGRVSADLEADGPLARPALRGTVRWAEPRVAELVLDSAAASFETEAGELRFDASLRADDGEVLSARGALPTERLGSGEALLASPRLRLDLRGEDVDLGLFAPLLPERVPHLGGRARLAFELQGGPVPSAEGELRWSGGSVEVVGLPGRLEPVEATLRAARHEQGIALEVLELRAAGQLLSARGVLGAESFHGLDVELRDWDAAWLAPLVDAGGELEGILAGRVSLDGPFSAPRIAGRLTWQTPRLGSVRFESIDADLATERGDLVATLRARALSREVLVADLRVPLDALRDAPARALASPAFRARVAAEAFDLAALEPFLPAGIRDLAGRLDAEFDIEGAAAAPRVRGSAALAEGAVAIPLLRVTLAPIAGRLELAGDAVRIEELRIGAPGSGARLSGTVALEALRPTDLDLALEAQHFTLSRNPLLAMDATGSIELGGTAGAPRLTGALALEKASVSLRAADDPALKEITVVAQDSGGEAVFEESGPAAPGPLAASTIDFRLSVPRNTWVRGEGADLEIQGDLELRKRPFEEPALIGSTRVVRGSYTFQRKRFDVRRGSATFDGATAIDPVLDVEAEHRVADITVLLFVTGRASSPKLRLASEPPLPETDVVSYLFLGRPADQLTGGGGQGLESAAAGLAAGIAAKQAVQLLAGSLPVDSLDVRIGESGAPAEISVGKYLNERIFVRYGRTIGPDPVDEVSVELGLTDHLSLESDVSSDANAGVDVIWSLDY